MERNTRPPAPNFQITFYKTTVSWVWIDELGVQHQISTKINLGSRHPRLGKKKRKKRLKFSGRTQAWACFDVPCLILFCLLFILPA